MTKEELKKEADKYADGYATPDLDFDFRAHIFEASKEAYLAGAEPREKRIEELERKLEQTEKDLTDYQFNYPKIKDLEKENGKLLQRIAQLEKDVTENESDCSMCDFPKLKQELEKENAELKKFVNAPHTKGRKTTRGDYIKTVWDLSKQLTKAKELLAKWVELYKPKIDTVLPPPIQVDTEKFLKE